MDLGKASEPVKERVPKKCVFDLNYSGDPRRTFTPDSFIFSTYTFSNSLSDTRQVISFISNIFSIKGLTENFVESAKM